jgi:hypothetical protein
MAERNPNIPSERRVEVEERTRINEDEANRRFAQKQAKLQEQADTFADGSRDNETEEEQVAAAVARITIDGDADGNEQAQ